MPPGGAREDFTTRLGRPSDADAAPAPAAVLPQPDRVSATGGRGQVTVSWTPVPGAAGYLVHRADGRAGPWRPIDHWGGDVLAVPSASYADTTGVRDRPAWYAVAALPSVAGPHGPLSAPVTATASSNGVAAVGVRVDADGPGRPLHRLWRPMIGAEHLALLRRGAGPGGRPVGEELARALVMARTELGVQAVRAHGILLDELGVYRDVGGKPVHDFTGVDAIYDRVLALGLRPVVELSFMPRDLAADPTATVFDYGAVISPPKDWDRWEALVGDLTAHLVARYGRDEMCRHWAFEVWNEANLEVFWTGTQADYFRLYDVSARAVKAVDPGLRIGGPSTAAAGWVSDLLDHVAESGAPLDFLSTHTYGNAPLDVRVEAQARGRGDLPVWWTEWGVTPTHFAAVNDAVFGAPFLLRGMKAAHGRADALAYWVVSDHFEELGGPPRLLHGGFGLLTVGNLRKPRWWALAMLERLGDDLVPVALSGDGAGSLVEAWATRAGDGRVAVLAWNVTYDQSKVDGDLLLNRRVDLRIDGLTVGDWRLRHWRVDQTHSNIAVAWENLDGGDWPDEDGWAVLRDADRLDEFEPPRTLSVRDGGVQLSFPLPMPGISLLELTPV